MNNLRLKISNRLEGAAIIEHDGLKLAFQGNVDPDYYHWMNPNDGRPIKKANVGGQPNLLGHYNSMRDEWDYYKDAILLFHHPHSADPDFAGLYVRVDAGETLVFDSTADFLSLREQQLAGNAHSHAKPDEGGAEIVQLFPAPSQ